MNYHYSSDDCLKKRQELIRKFYAQLAIVMAKVDRLEEKLEKEIKVLKERVATPEAGNFDRISKPSVNK